MAASYSSVPESPPQTPVVIPRRSPRIAARRSASTYESAAQQSRLPKTKSRSIKPIRQRDQPTKRTRTKAAAHSSGGTPSKKIKLVSKTSTTFEEEPSLSSCQSGTITSHSLELQDKLSITSWEQLPAKLLAKVIPWTNSRAVESARNVCQTWRLNIDAFILLKESFTGDVLNNNVWKTEKLNTKIFKVDCPMRGYLRREAKRLSKFNQWSSLTTRQLLPSGTIISYMVRFPVSWGRETKFTVTGGATLRRANVDYQPTHLSTDNSAFAWQRWDGKFHGIAYSAVSPGERWYSIAQEVVSDGVITYEDGRRLFKLACRVPQEGIEGALLLQHLDVGSAVCMDIANFFIIKLY